ncbi:MULTISPECIES: hypothetical protein [unclassified Wolbachia]|uniref:hypothetical protein n=1 Tax=unclassified Wolbachia TaxID=2640676 RepID=UPI00110698A6|nr:MULTISPECIES: hypothetical protein [unclassified Wolbachia]QVU15324.1 Uncharacterized protein wYak_00930 [Wolbachia endosymbiont of Drosophila yakuba]QVU16667.1 Uncharacterized protein wSan_03580 [Wolbachia endosymbiont of Drosophila santomea]TLW83068.1 hypothetical protein FFT13_04450 [Wolbachia endosymbiont of Drosophila santomea]TLW87295.1 hypothetical protein FFT11_01200 [Wolbachia endosymbiont of Drosophila yakuba]
MLSLESGTIKVADDKIVLIIKKDDSEEFKKYKNVDKSGAIIDGKFYVSCTLNGQQLYIISSYPQEELGDKTIINVKSVRKKGGKYPSRLEEMKNLLGFNDGKEEIMVKDLSFHPTLQSLEKKNVKVTELEAAEEQLKGKNEELEAAKKKAEEELRIKTQELQDQLDTAQQEKQDLEAEVEKLKAIDSTALQQQLEEKNAKITELEAQLNNQPNAAQLKAKENEIIALKDQVQQLQAAPNDTAAQLKAKKDETKDLQNRLTEAEEKNRKLEDKSKTTEQPKQGNGARYTATVGMGLAAGLIAFTALERTVKLEMLVMIGIAVASALVAGGITYAVLPSTQVDGAKAQEVNENGKKK